AIFSATKTFWRVCLHVLHLGEHRHISPLFRILVYFAPFGAFHRVWFVSECSVRLNGVRYRLAHPVHFMHFVTF
ncbi:hypothetical protein, partial [Sphingobacterium bovisgrunnientis]|uniref:hypothetical protein n=1 Tax=Sphingobacterium bovisgrunnientis TaxID=1874697 RepID=UPI001958EC1D